MAIRQKTHLTINLTGRGTSHSRCEVDTPSRTIVIDEPVARGGTDEGPSPTEKAYAALVGCTNVIGQKCADKLGIDIGHLTFQLTVKFDRRGVLLMEPVEVPFPDVSLHVTSDGPASPAELQQVAAETEKFCPISKLFANSGTNLEVTWSKASLPINSIKGGNDETFS